MIARSITLRPGQPLDGLAWQEKDILDVLPHEIDARPLLADLGLTMNGDPVIRCDPSLSVLLTSVDDPVVRLQIGGGTADTLPRVSILLLLLDGEERAMQLELVVTLPVVARVPAGLVLAPDPANDRVPALLYTAIL